MSHIIINIIRKECARFFGDKALVFTAIIMPGLLLYLVYTLVGRGLSHAQLNEPEPPAVVYMENRPRELSPLLDSLPLHCITYGFDTAHVLDLIREKESGVALVQFPPQFITTSAPQQAATQPPLIRISYNPSSLTSARSYDLLTHTLRAYEHSVCPLFDIDAHPLSSTTLSSVDSNPTDKVAADAQSLLSEVLPMLILMMLFAGCMAVAPTSIAGEKERGTIATLLVTPLNRNELAWGKILSLSCFALLSGVSSMAGIMLSLPQLISSGGIHISTGNYPASHLLALLLVVLSTVLMFIGLISIISALATSVKQATSFVSPLMFVVMFVGLTPVFGAHSDSIALYLVPLHNSVLCMTDIFGQHIHPGTLTIAITINLVITALEAWLLTRLFNSERIMFSH